MGDDKTVVGRIITKKGAGQEPPKQMKSASSFNIFDVVKALWEIVKRPIVKNGMETDDGENSMIRKDHPPPNDLDNAHKPAKIGAKSLLYETKALKKTCFENKEEAESGTEPL